MGKIRFIFSTNMKKLVRKICKGLDLKRKSEWLWLINLANTNWCWHKNASLCDIIMQSYRTLTKMDIYLEKTFPCWVLNLINWKPRVIIMPILSTLAVHGGCYDNLRSSATGDGKVGIMTIFGAKCYKKKKTNEHKIGHSPHKGRRVASYHFRIRPCYA